MLQTERSKKKLFESAARFRQELERSREISARFSRGKELNPWFSQKNKSAASKPIEILDESLQCISWQEVCMSEDAYCWFGHR
jgi:hypothetical protein